MHALGGRFTRDREAVVGFGRRVGCGFQSLGGVLDHYEVVVDLLEGEGECREGCHDARDGEGFECGAECRGGRCRHGDAALCGLCRVAEVERARSHSREYVPEAAACLARVAHSLNEDARLLHDFTEARDDVARAHGYLAEHGGYRASCRGDGDHLELVLLLLFAEACEALGGVGDVVEQRLEGVDRVEEGVD